MNPLLDTHVLLWIASGQRPLGERTRIRIEDPTALVFVSAASAWEIAIKRSLGKLDAPDDFEAMLETYRFTPLDIRTQHALAVERLPNHHQDPFNRILIAQSLSENLTIVTHDAAFDAYDVRTLPAFD